MPEFDVVVHLDQPHIAKAEGVGGWKTVRRIMVEAQDETQAMIVAGNIASSEGMIEHIHLHREPDHPA